MSDTSNGSRNQGSDRDSHFKRRKRSKPEASREKVRMATLNFRIRKSITSLPKNFAAATTLSHSAQSSLESPKKQDPGQLRLQNQL